MLRSVVQLLSSTSLSFCPVKQFVGELWSEQLVLICRTKTGLFARAVFVRLHSFPSLHVYGVLKKEAFEKVNTPTLCFLPLIMFFLYVCVLLNIHMCSLHFVVPQHFLFFLPIPITPLSSSRPTLAEHSFSQLFLFFPLSPTRSHGHDSAGG